MFVSVVGGHPDPLVRVADAGQPVGIHDGGGARRQRLPDLRRAGDRRRARRGGVGAAETAAVAALVSVSALLASSVKLTVTLIVVPWSAATSV